MGWKRQCRNRLLEALVQLSMQSQGLLVPRDTSLQINSSVFTTTDFQDVKRGCLIFWEGHVAIFINKTNIVLNAYSMTTTKNHLWMPSKELKKII